ncbi:MAG: RelA/SpoT domain-containing protein [Paracoccaceae bacterium]
MVFEIIEPASRRASILEVFPNHSKGEVNRAGRRLAQNEATDDDMGVIENWRASHNHILNTFQENLRRRAKLSDARTPVQRIKRLETIQNKLVRYPDMKLARMHDIVGCRVVFNNIEELERFRREFNKSRFSHIRRMKKGEHNKTFDRYDYITNPKASGYRGIHDVFEFRAKQGGQSKKAGGEKWNGLNIEVQYRTQIQHAWATAVEICDKFTENHGKFSNAPDDYLLYFQIASELLARHFEDMTGGLPEPTTEQLISDFLGLEKKHGMLHTLEGIQPSQEKFSDSRHSLLIFDEKAGTTKVLPFKLFREAVEEYFRLERESDNDVDVVLVAGEDSESVRFGFKNYFSDAREFVDYMHEACNFGI